MKRWTLALAAATACSFAPAARAQNGQVNVIGSLQADGCSLIQPVFTKSTGIKVNMSLKGSGDALAQLIAERANPKTDVGFSGTGDPHLQAAESEQRHGPHDDRDPRVAISFVRDGPGEKQHGSPVATITPSKGTGAEIGSMGIVKGARNLEQAKKFYEWALTAGAQQFGAAATRYQLPSNKATVVDANVPDFKKIKLINDDHAKYGSSTERKRLIARWEKNVNSLPR